MKHLLTLVLFLSFIPLYSQYTNVQIQGTGTPEEVSICINPKNVNYIVAGSNITNYYFSTNKGLTWTNGTLNSSSYGVWGDPCIIVDTMGYFYFLHLSSPPNGMGSWIDRIVCQKSTNNGQNWTNPGTYTYMNAPKQQDKEWAIVDRRNNNIYVTWTQFDSYGTSTPTDSSRILFSKSTDGGITWVNFGSGTAKRLDKLGGDCVDEDNTVEGAVPAVGPNGEVYVAWAGPLVRNSQFGIFFTKSTDAGNTFTEPVYVCDQTGGWDYMIAGIQRANGLPVTCCDLSTGPYRGNIYINYTDEPTSLDHDVKLVKSTNGGQTWSAPKRVNDDIPGNEQFFTWMTVDQKTGQLYFVFYDRRNGTGNSTDVYMARSTDGGETFVNFKVSTTPFVPVSSVFFGDYTGIDAYNGTVRPIWMRLQSNALSVWTAMVDFSTPVINNSENLPKNFNLSQNYPNPFNPTTKIKYDVPQNANGDLSKVQIVVFDATGKEITKIVDALVKAGSYEAEWNGAGYPSGVYFYKLICGNYMESKKMVLVR